ncbi:MAG: hypothetical protein ACLFST_13070, partial [Spirochaetia bacterium]
MTGVIPAIPALFMGFGVLKSPYHVFKESGEIPELSDHSSPSPGPAKVFVRSTTASTPVSAT